MRVVRVSPPTAEAERTWRKLVELASEFADSEDWCLVGGLMVQLFAYEHESASRPTTDIDILGDARERPSGTRWLAEKLRGLGASLHAVGVGSFESAALTLTEPDRVRNRRMSRTTSSGRCCSPTSSR